MNYLEKFKDEKQLILYISKRLKSLRESRKLTQNEMSNLMNMEEEYYGRVERGKYKPTIFFLITFCSKLSISIDDFFNIDTSSGIDSYLKEYITLNKSSLIDLRDFLNKTLDNVL